MRTTYVKSQRHTQQQARNYVSVMEEVCSRAGINKDEWLLQMFELGCQYAKLVAASPDWLERVLKDEEEGFWAWWLNLYLHDDAALLKFNYPLDLGRYQNLKSEFTNYISKK